MDKYEDERTESWFNIMVKQKSAFIEMEREKVRLGLLKWVDKV